MELKDAILALPQEYADEETDDPDIYTEEGLEEEEECDGITAAERGFMFGYLSA